MSMTTTLDDSFKSEVLAGLRKTPKQLSPKFFYDERGSQLFERICALEEYYPTRTELGILRREIEAITEKIGPNCLLFEFGSGSSKKTRLLLDRMKELVAYLPIDISGEFLASASEGLRALYPGLTIMPICADFTRSMLPFEGHFPSSQSRAGFLPGSTLGNFTPSDAADFLRSVAGLLGMGGKFLVGIDLFKEKSVLESAYNDAQGVTAEFNRNVLHRIKNELGARIEIEDFEHHAFFNSEESRIEMHLISLKDQTIEIDREAIRLYAGESIHTENSYKYTPEGFKELVSSAGFDVLDAWLDPDQYFGIFLLEVQEAVVSSKAA